MAAVIFVKEKEEEEVAGDGRLDWAMSAAALTCHRRRCWQGLAWVKTMRRRWCVWVGERKSEKEIVRERSEREGVGERGIKR